MRYLHDLINCNGLTLQQADKMPPVGILRKYSFIYPHQRETSSTFVFDNCSYKHRSINTTSRTVTDNTIPQKLRALDRPRLSSSSSSYSRPIHCSTSADTSPKLALCLRSECPSRNACGVSGHGGKCIAVNILYNRLLGNRFSLRVIH